jgi:hypothetical protein
MKYLLIQECAKRPETGSLLGMGRAHGHCVKHVWWAVAAGITALILPVLLSEARDGERQNAVGTTGHAMAEPEDSPATLHDLETATGAVDQNELIGRRVDFHVTVAGLADSTSFWVGNKDNRMLVVLGPDPIQSVKAGQMARITGTIEGLPKPLNDQKVYIRADNVIPE